MGPEHWKRTAASHDERRTRTRGEHARRNARRATARSRMGPRRGSVGLDERRCGSEQVGSLVQARGAAQRGGLGPAGCDLRPRLHHLPLRRCEGDLRALLQLPRLGARRAPQDFYQIAIENSTFGHPAVYDVPIYAIFALWNLPTYRALPVRRLRLPEFDTGAAVAEADGGPLRAGRRTTRDGDREDDRHERGAIEMGRLLLPVVDGALRAGLRDRAVRHHLGDLHARRPAGLHEGQDQVLPAVVPGGDHPEALRGVHLHPPRAAA